MCLEDLLAPPWIAERARPAARHAQANEGIAGAALCTSNAAEESLWVAPDDIMLVPKGTIPKTTSGKVQRILCKKIYLEDEFIPKKHKNAMLLIRTFLMSHFHLFRRRLKQ